MSTRKLNAPVQYRSVQRKERRHGKKATFRLKMHLYEAHSLRVTVTVHQYPL